MGHRALTLPDIREAYQSQLPQRRDDFRDEVKRLKDDHSAKGDLFSRHIYDVAKAAKKEMRARYEAAMVCVQALLDDGWVPSEGQTVESIYRDVFQSYRSIDRETFSDLTSAVEAAYADIGNNGPDIRGVFAREIGEVGVTAYEKCVAQLRLYRPRARDSGNTFTGHVGAVQIGDANVANVRRTQGSGSSEEAYIIAESADDQLERERRGEPRIPRQHFEVLLDPSLMGVIVRPTAVAPIEPQDRADPNDDDPMGRIMLENIGRTPAVRLRLTMPVRILTASPFTEEANAYQRDQVIPHEILVRVLRPGSLMITVTNRLAAPIDIGVRPEAYDERDVAVESGFTTVRRNLVIQTLVLIRISASRKRSP